MFYQPNNLHFESGATDQLNERSGPNELFIRQNLERIGHSRSIHQAVRPKSIDAHQDHNNACLATTIHGNGDNSYHASENVTSRSFVSQDDRNNRRSLQNESNSLNPLHYQSTPGCCAPQPYSALTLALPNKAVYGPGIMRSEPTQTMEDSEFESATGIWPMMSQSGTIAQDSWSTAMSIAQITSHNASRPERFQDVDMQRVHSMEMQQSELATVTRQAEQNDLATQLIAQRRLLPAAVQRQRTQNKAQQQTVVKSSVKKTKRRSSQALVRAPRTPHGAFSELYACIRCQRVKKACLRSSADPRAPCLLCRTVGPDTLRIPCIRTHISDIELFRRGTTEKDTWTVRTEVTELGDLPAVSGESFKKISLTHDYGAATLDVYVREYSPMPDDQTAYEHTLSDGRIYREEMPPLAITELSRTKTAVDRYVSEHFNVYVEHHLDPGSILWNTFDLASRRAHHNENEFLAKVLRFWTASRLIEKPWRITGDDEVLNELNLEVVENAESPYMGQIPVTPIMDTQMDQVVIQSVLIPQRELILRELQQLITKRSGSDWFDIFAAIVILLNNIEIATAHDNEFAEFHGHISSRGSRFEDYTLVESYFHGARTLIAHFRDATHGRIPFRKGWLDQNFDLITGIDDEERRFLQKTQETLTARNFQGLKRDHKYESLFYWTHQLFYEDWDASDVHIKEKERSALRASDSILPTPTHSSISLSNAVRDSSQASHDHTPLQTSEVLRPIFEFDPTVFEGIEDIESWMQL